MNISIEITNTIFEPKNKGGHTMAIDDTIKLLQECTSGIDMAIDSINEILESVVNENLKKILRTSREKHQELATEAQNLLQAFHDEPKSSPIIAKSMSHMKTNFKMMTKPSDETIADLITEGCNMGIKSLHRYKNQYSEADKDAQKLTQNIINLESDLRESICMYLYT